MVRGKCSLGLAGAALLASALASGFPGAALARCDKCTPPYVLQFDFTVNVPKPEAWGPEMFDYFVHHAVANVAGSEVFNGNHECIHFRDGDMVLTGELRVSNTIAFPPPGGKLDTGDDYIFTGEVSRAGSENRVTMVLETACSRQRALSASGTYTVAHETKIDTDSDLGKKYAEAYEQWERSIPDYGVMEDPPPIPEELLPPDWHDEVSKLAREAFVPLLPKIREFERRLRKTDRRVAIDVLGDGRIDVVPQKRHAKPFERIPVEITLTDCDGERLPGREVILDPGGDGRLEPSINGKFAEPRVTTDDSGTARATFVVGAKRGVAFARANLVYLRPSGCEVYAIDEAVIDVDGTAALYEVRFEYEEGRKVAADTTEALEGGSRTVSYRDGIELRMGCTGVWENPEEAQREGVIELSGAPLEGCRTTGEYRGLETQRERTDIHSPSGGPGLSASDYTRTGHMRRLTRGTPVAPTDEPADIFLRYQGGAEPDTHQFGLEVPFDVFSEVFSGGLEVVSAGGVVVRTPYSDRQSSRDRTTFGVGVPDTTYREERASIVVEGATASSETEGETTTERSARVRAVITPVRSLEDAAPRRPPGTNPGARD